MPLPVSSDLFPLFGSVEPKEEETGMTIKSDDDVKPGRIGNK